MKRVHGLMAVAIMCVGCSQTAPPEPAAPATQVYGTLAQVMRGIPFPASNIIFDTQTTDPGASVEATEPGAAQGATAQFSGVYGGWQAVENAAITLSETANLLTVPGRMCENGRPAPIDQEDFQMWARGLAEAGQAALKAAQSRDLDAMVDVSGTVSDACAACHEKYRDTADVKDRCIP